MNNGKIRNRIKNKIQICIVSEFPPPDGGIGQQAKLLSDSLINEDFDVKIVAQNGYMQCGLKKLKDIKYLKTAAALVFFLKTLISSIPKTEIVHILSGSYLNFFLFTTPAVLLGKIYKKKVIIHYHGGGAKDFLKKWHPFVRNVLKLSDHIIFPSGYLSNVFKTYRYTGSVIPNILNLQNFQYVKRKHIKPKFIVTRHLRPEYNVACVIKAFALIRKVYPNAVLNIIGDGPQKRELIEITKMLRCEDSVFFIGQVPNNEMPNFYINSDFNLNASMVDNMPVSILEAFACGCLVITTATGGIPYIVKNRINGLMVPLNDHFGLAKEAIWALRNQKLTSIIAENAKNEVSKYTWNEIKKMLYALYEDNIE